MSPGQAPAHPRPPWGPPVTGAPLLSRRLHPGAWQCFRGISSFALRLRLSRSLSPPVCPHSASQDVAWAAREAGQPTPPSEATVKVNEQPARWKTGRGGAQVPALTGVRRGAAASPAGRKGGDPVQTHAGGRGQSQERKGGAHEWGHGRPHSASCQKNSPGQPHVPAGAPLDWAGACRARSGRRAGWVPGAGLLQLPAPFPPEACRPRPAVVSAAINQVQPFLRLASERAGRSVA